MIDSSFLHITTNNGTAVVASSDDIALKAQVGEVDVAVCSGYRHTDHTAVCTALDRTCCVHDKVLERTGGCHITKEAGTFRAVRVDVQIADDVALTVERTAEGIDGSTDGLEVLAIAVHIDVLGQLGASLRVALVHDFCIGEQTCRSRNQVPPIHEELTFGICLATDGAETVLVIVIGHGGLVAGCIVKDGSAADGSVATILAVCIHLAMRSIQDGMLVLANGLEPNIGTRTFIQAECQSTGRGLCLVEVRHLCATAAEAVLVGHFVPGEGPVEGIVFVTGNVGR